MRKQHSATLVALRPPFVLTASSDLHWPRLGMVAGACTGLAATTWACGTSPCDLFRGAMAVVQAVRT